MTEFVSLFDAETNLSLLVDRAAAGEEIVITRDGIPLARLVSVPFSGEARRPAHALGLRKLPEDFDEPLPVEVLNWFEPS